MNRQGRRHRVVVRGLTGIAVLALLATGGCSDDSGGADRGLDAAPADQGAADQGRDLGVDQAPKPDTTSSTGCSTAVVGKSCTKGGSECGKDHTCLVPSGTQGWCTCSCTVDSAGTTYDEDTCPGSSLQCAAYDAGGGAGAKPYCFKVVGGQRGTTLSWWSPIDATAPWMLATRNTPGAYPFSVIGVSYLLIGSTKYCTTTLAHTVDLVLSSSSTPDASPTATQSFSIAATTTAETVRRVVRFLTTPASLTSGQHGYLLINMAVDSTKNEKICVMSAGNNSVFQSKVVKAPYTWEAKSGSAQLMLLGF